jgi:hypothetical protein
LLYRLGVVYVVSLTTVSHWLNIRRTTSRFQKINSHIKNDLICRFCFVQLESEMKIFAKIFCFWKYQTGLQLCILNHFVNSQLLTYFITMSGTSLPQCSERNSGAEFKSALRTAFVKMSLFWIQRKSGSLSFSLSKSFVIRLISDLHDFPCRRYYFFCA